MFLLFSLLCSSVPAEFAFPTVALSTSACHLFCEKLCAKKPGGSSL